MKIKKVTHLKEKYPECDITTKNGNFYIKCGDSYILIHNSPAIFAGEDPETGEFFVGTKSIFNKTIPKLNFTAEDVDRNHKGELAKKLKIALKHLAPLGIKGRVIQGDMMWTKGDLNRDTIDGENYVTFQPNTIVYAVPAGSKLANEIKTKDLGIVWHTEYTGGSKVSEMSASFGVDKNSIKKSPKVWQQDAYFKDTSGTSTFTNRETKELDKVLSKIGKTFQKINGRLLDQVATPPVSAVVKIFHNARVRSGQQIGNVKHYMRELEEFIIDRDKQAELPVIDFLKKNRKQFELILTLQDLLLEGKMIIVRKLETVKGMMNTFVKTADGFKVTTPEGFVSIDNLSGNAVKLVDRLTFSRNNFLVDKNWDK
jgi:hypothetical protein